MKIGLFEIQTLNHTAYTVYTNMVWQQRSGKNSDALRLLLVEKTERSIDVGHFRTIFLSSRKFIGKL